MKIAFIGDIQVNPLKWPRYRQALEVLSQKCEDVRVALIAGDVFEYHQMISGGSSVSHGTMYDALLRTFDRLSVYCVPGNHDLPPLGQQNLFAPLQSWHVANHIQACQEEEFGLVLVPWLQSPEDRAQAEVEMVRAATRLKAENRVLLAHCSIDGALAQNRSVMIGDEFTLSKRVISECGFQCVVLGHIHLRQDIPVQRGLWAGYVGSLVQNNYGEGFKHTKSSKQDHAPQGFAVWDTQSQSIEWRDIDVPRHWTVYAPYLQEYVSDISATDMVKVKIEKGTDVGVVPENYVVEADVVVEEDINVRVEGIDKHIDDPIELLRQWLIVNPQADNNDVVEKTLQILPHIKVAPMVAGKLDYVARIYLKNIALYRDTEVDFSDTRGMIGISGKTGSGKTYLLETVCAALYGRYPSRGRPLYRDATRGYVGDAAIEADVVVGGVLYRFERHIHKTKSGTGKVQAYVRRMENGAWVDCAGPDGDSVTAFAVQLVGDPAILNGSVFSFQDQIGNLMDADPKDRKLWFSRVFGLERYLAIGEYAEKLIAEKNAQISALRDSIAEYEIQLAQYDVPGAKKIILENETVFNETKTKISDLYDRLVGVKSEKNEIAANRSRKNAKIQEWNKLNDDIIIANAAIAGMRNEIDRLSAVDIRESLAWVQSHPIDMALYTACRDDLRTKRTVHSEMQVKLERQRGLLSSIKKDIDADVNRMRVEVQNSMLSAERKMQSDVREHVSKCDEARRTINALQKTIQSHEELIKKNAGIPNVAECEACPLRAHIVIAEKAIKSARDEITTLENIIEEERAIAVDIERMARASIEVMRGEHAKISPEMPEMVVKYKAQFDEILDTGRALREATDSLYAEICDIGEKVQQFEMVISEKASHDAVIQRENDKVQKRLELMVRIDEQARRVDAMAEQAACMKREIDAWVIPDDTHLNNKIDEIDACIHNQSVTMESARNEITRQESIVADYDVVRATIEKKRTAMNEISDAIAPYNAIKSAFGRDGIPQLVLDSARDPIHRYLDRLFEVFDNQFAIRIDTQKDTKRGIKEDVVIRVIDRLGEDDIRSYSGGQKHFLKSIFRIAISMYLRERYGNYRVYLFDEIFDKLDIHETAPKMLELVSGMTSDFNQVFVISHVPDLIRLIPTRIIVEVENGVSIARCEITP